MTHQGFRIAVASGKGGTGKTTVSVNLLYAIKDELKDKGHKITLVDCDVEEPNVVIFTGGEFELGKKSGILVPEIIEDKCIYCGVCARVCNYNAIVFVKKIPKIMVMEDLCHGCGACTRFCAPRAIKEKFKHLGDINYYKLQDYKLQDNVQVVEGRLNVGDTVPTPVLRDTKGEVAHEPFVIYDAPPGTSCSMVETIEDADYVVLVSEPTPFGLNDLKLAYEVVREMDKRAGLIINRSDLGTENTREFAAEVGLPLLMEIPFDRRIAEVYSRGGIVVEELPDYKEKFRRVYEYIVHGQKAGAPS